MKHEIIGDAFTTPTQPRITLHNNIFGDFLTSTILPNIGEVGSLLEVRRGKYQSFLTLGESKPNSKIEK